METDGDVLWVRVPGDGSLNYINTEGEILAYNLTSGELTNRHNLNEFSDILNGKNKLCPYSFEYSSTRILSFGSLENSNNYPECTIINGDYSRNYSSLYLTICSVNPVNIPIPSPNGGGMVLFSQSYCEFIKLSKSFNLISKYSSTDNYSVSYATDVATYRIFSSGTIENLDSGLTGILPDEFCGYPYSPPYVLLNGTIIIVAGGQGCGRITVHYYESIENNQSLVFNHNSYPLENENSAWPSCITPAGLNYEVIYSNGIQIREIYDLEYGIYSDHHHFSEEVREHLDEHTMIPPKWFMFRVLDDLTDCNIAKETYFTAYDIDRSNLWYASYDTENIHPNPCIINYRGEGEYKLDSCGIHNGVEYSWEESNDFIPSSYIGLFALLLFFIIIIIVSVWFILGVRRALKNSPISRLFLLILFLSTTIWFATLEKAEGGSIESILGVSLAGGFVIWLLPALFLSLYRHGFRVEDLEDDLYKVWYIDIRRMDKLPGCYKCKKDRGKCVCPPAPQKLSKKEQRRMDLMANVAIEELLGKTSSRSCSNGTGFWGVGKCTGTPVHACKRCSTYVCSMHVSKRTTYKGAYVCATCDSNMSD